MQSDITIECSRELMVKKKVSVFGRFSENNVTYFYTLADSYFGIPKLKYYTAKCAILWFRLMLYTLHTTSSLLLLLLLHFFVLPNWDVKT